jgi:hypothetical protein
MCVERRHSNGPLWLRVRFRSRTDEKWRRNSPPPLRHISPPNALATFCSRSYPALAIISAWNKPNNHELKVTTRKLETIWRTSRGWAIFCTRKLRNRQWQFLYYKNTLFYAVILVIFSTPLIVLRLKLNWKCSPGRAIAISLYLTVKRTNSLEPSWCAIKLLWHKSFLMRAARVREK